MNLETEILVVPKNTTKAFNRNGEASKAFGLDGVDSYIDLSNRSGWKPGIGDFSFFFGLGLKVDTQQMHI